MNEPFDVMEMSERNIVQFQKYINQTLSFYMEFEKKIFDKIKETEKENAWHHLKLSWLRDV